MNPISILESNLENFTKSERRIAQSIIDDPISIIQRSAEEIVQSSGSSKSAFIRLCQKLGYQGYSEFRFSLSKYLISHKVSDEEDLSIIQSITSVYSDHIKQIAQLLSLEDNKKLCRLISSSNRLKIFGQNRTGLAAQQLRMRMAKIGFDCEYSADLTLMKDITSSLSKEDLVIIFSIKGMSIYEDIIRQAKMNNTSTVLITMSQNTSLSKDCDMTITLPYVSRATDRFLDDQAIFFVFIEILLAGLAELED